jgi:amino acid transporter
MYMAATHRNKIGLGMATIIGVNAMIGAGIFLVPTALAKTVGPAGIISYAFVIIAVWFMGSSLARLAQLFPQEGSFYIYTKEWGGHIMGLASAGSYLLGLTIAMGLLAQIAALYLHAILPGWSTQTLGALILFSLITLNMMGVTMSQAGQKLLIIPTLFPLLFTIFACLPHAKLSNLSPFMPYGLKNIFGAIQAVIFGFFGFECASSLFAIVDKPEKNISKALTYSIAIVGVLYLLFVTSLFLAIPTEQFTVTELSGLLKIILPDSPLLTWSIHVSILGAILGTLHSMIWACGALLLSYLKQFKILVIQNAIKKETIRQSTTVGILGVCIFTSYTLLHNMNLFFNLTAIFIVFAYASSMITLLTMKDEWRSGKNYTTLLGLGTAFIIFVFAFEGLISSLN